MPWLRRIVDRSKGIAAKPEQLLHVETDAQEPASKHPTARDLINLGEHLFFLSRPDLESLEDLDASLAAFTKRLEQCGFAGTRAAAKSIEDTTVGALKLQLPAISSTLYDEASKRQAEFINLGEYLWHVSNPKMATPEALDTSIAGFLKMLEKCSLKTRATAKPLERFRYVYFVRHNLVSGDSLDQLASIMETVRQRLEDETRGMEIAP